MGMWLYRINVDPSRDPDWGDKAQYSNSILKVVVGPKKDKEWTFYLIIPADDDMNEMTMMAQTACENFLNKGDQYVVAELNQDDIEEFNNAIPILIYQPYTRGEFLWVVPPTYMKN